MAFMIYFIFVISILTYANASCDIYNYPDMSNEELVQYSSYLIRKHSQDPIHLYNFGAKNPNETKLLLDKNLKKHIDNNIHVVLAIFDIDKYADNDQVLNQINRICLFNTYTISIYHFISGKYRDKKIITGKKHDYFGKLQIPCPVTFNGRIHYNGKAYLNGPTIVNGLIDLEANVHDYTPDRTFPGSNLFQMRIPTHFIMIGEYNMDYMYGCGRSFPLNEKNIYFYDKFSHSKSKFNLYSYTCDEYKGRTTFVGVFYLNGYPKLYYQTDSTCDEFKASFELIKKLSKHINIEPNFPKWNSIYSNNDLPSEYLNILSNYVLINYGYYISDDYDKDYYTVLKITDETQSRPACSTICYYVKVTSKQNVKSYLQSAVRKIIDGVFDFLFIDLFTILNALPSILFQL